MTEIQKTAREPRILIYDLETSLQLAAIFALANNDWIRPENLVTERHILSVCWKWLGEKTVHSLSLLDDPKRFAADPHDDRYVVEEFCKVYADADVVVTQNGDSFDNKYLKTRALYHKLPPLPPVTSIDTKKLAKKYFYFNSNSLDYLGKYLSLGGKKPTTPGLWLRVLDGDVAAFKLMVSYNKRDVTLLEDLFMRLRPYVPDCINRELFGKTGCPRCGSSKVQSRGTHRALTRTYRRLQCTACGGWFRILKADTGNATKHRMI